MSFHQSEICGVHCWSLESWSERGVFHGFLGRGLDISGKDVGAEAAWCRQFAASKPFNLLDLRLLEQVHGTQIARVLGGQNPHRAIEADAWLLDLSWLSSESFVWGIKTADCFPVLLSVRHSQLAAAAHCGWRGAVDGLLPRVIAELCQLGAAPQAIEIAIGPGAQQCCYEVSAEVGHSFADAASAAKLPLGDTSYEVCSSLEQGKTHCDIRRLLQLQAAACDVPQSQVFSVDFCTICDQRFFSYRREKSLSGRQLSFIGKIPRIGE